MPDPLTQTIRLTEPTVGGDSGAWGGLINSDMVAIDAAVNGILAITLSSVSLTLEAAGDSGDQARWAWYNFTGTPGGTCTVTLPTCQKIGVVTNSTVSNVILTTGSGGTLTITPGQTLNYFCDGTNVGLLPWGSPGTYGVIGVTGTTTLTVLETGSLVEFTNGAYTVTLPTPVGNAGVNFLLYNTVVNNAAVTISTPSGAFVGPAGNQTSTLVLTSSSSNPVFGPFVQVVSDGTNWVTDGTVAFSMPLSYSSYSTTVSLTIKNCGFVEFTGVGFTATLPTPVGNAGRQFIFFAYAAVNGSITLSTPSGTFSGPQGSGSSTNVITASSTAPTYPAYASVISDGTNWIVTSPGGNHVVNSLVAIGNEALHYQNTGGQNIPNSTLTTVTNWTKIYDRINASFSYTNGVYTAPVAGYYLVTFQSCGVTSSGYASGATWNNYLVCSDGTEVISAGPTVSGSLMTPGTTVSALFKMAAGATITPRVFQDQGAPVATNSTQALNYFSVVQIP
jgi:hypothetical protein